jgi:hypothetical protein
MFERFTADAKQAVVLGAEGARSSGMTLSEQSTS